MRSCRRGQNKAWLQHRLEDVATAAGFPRASAEGCRHKQHGLSHFVTSGDLPARFFLAVTRLCPPAGACSQASRQQFTQRHLFFCIGFFFRAPFSDWSACASAGPASSYRAPTAALPGALPAVAGVAGLNRQLQQALRVRAGPRALRVRSSGA